MNRPPDTPEPTVQRTVARVHVEPRRGATGGEVTVLTLDSGVEGPTLAVTANLHGDETTGVGVVRRLDAWLQAHPFRGRVVLYPSCNPQGLRAQTRHVPADELDVNRVFPGNARGSWAARIAAALWRDLSVRRPDVVIDLHADAPLSVPYVIIDRPVRKTGAARRRLAARLETLAEATGLTVLREYPDDVYVQFGLDRSLAGAVVNLLGVPAVTVEAGPRRYIDADAVDVALQAVLGVLAGAGAVDHPVAPHPTRVEGCWRRASTPRTRRGGLVEPIAQPGTRFVRGDVLAHVVALSGELTEQVVATEDGVLISWVEACWVAPGGLLGTLGVPDRERL
ncbi:MAG: succinylglutamate desuccinylase/aspartoacylase family protein [Alphaproteobacteria bacterium]|nr:succinylglutamate desuccinylase/aspartoacylase family protein [Alphaproteobacteria bacterium]